MLRLLCLLVATIPLGCYSPQLANPGFYCHAKDNPACPDGQVCVNERCVDTGAHGDLAMHAGDGGGQDMAMSGSTDMAMQQTMQDFAMPPPADMTNPNSCSCASMCPIFKMCVGPNCCLEDTLLGTCVASTTCTPRMY